jgi:excisionase family DNA binding protein
VKLGKNHKLRRKRRARSGEMFDTPDDFAKNAGISRATVWRLMRDGRLRYARFGRTRRIPRTEYHRLVGA